MRTAAGHRSVCFRALKSDCRSVAALCVVSPSASHAERMAFSSIRSPKRTVRAVLRRMRKSRRNEACLAYHKSSTALSSTER